MRMLRWIKSISLKDRVRSDKRQDKSRDRYRTDKTQGQRGTIMMVWACKEK